MYTPRLAGYYSELSVDVRMGWDVRDEWMVDGWTMPVCRIRIETRRWILDRRLKCKCSECEM